jgi:hypothetical protein
VELGALVALGLAVGVLGLAGAELAKVLGRLGDDILEELKGDAAEGLTWDWQYERACFWRGDTMWECGWPWPIEACLLSLAD